MKSKLLIQKYLPIQLLIFDNFCFKLALINFKFFVATRNSFAIPIVFLWQRWSRFWTFWKSSADKRVCYSKFSFILAPILTFTDCPPRGGVRDGVVFFFPLDSSIFLFNKVETTCSTTFEVLNFWHVGKCSSYIKICYSI